MFGRFNRKREKASWNRKAVLRKCVEQSRVEGLSFTGSRILFDHNPFVYIDFITNQYADANVLDLNGSIFFVHNGEDIFFIDLVSLAKIVFGEKYKALSIKKHETWEGSNLDKETEKFLAPIFHVFGSIDLTLQFLNGKDVEAVNTILKIPDNPQFNWLLQEAQSLTYVFKKKV